MMEEQTVKGFILKITPFKERQQILTLYTEELGVISSIVKKSSGFRRARLKGGFSGSLTLFCEVEIVIKKGRGALYSSTEVEVIRPQLKIRRSLKTLQTAGELVKGITLSQPLEKRSPQLYSLFSLYFSRLASTTSPSTLSTSFLLKTLRHEGVLALTESCSRCRAPLRELFLCNGESLCSTHAPQIAIRFEEREREQLFQLTYSRSLEEIEKVESTEILESKIKQLFNRIYNEI